MTSYMTCGRRTGCDDGQGPVDSKVPLAGYATWLLWSGLSTFFPSQHLCHVSRQRPFSHTPTRFYVGYSRWESNRRPDSTGTVLFGNNNRIVPRARRSAKRTLLIVRHTPIANLALHTRRTGLVRVSRNHSEPGLECRDFGLAVVRRDVVDGDALVAAKPEVDVLRDTGEGAVVSVEVHVGCPVVGKILRESARCAGRLLGRVVHAGLHGRVERVAANDLVDMGGLQHAGVDEGIETFDDQPVALEAHHGGLGELRGCLVREERRGAGGNHGGLHRGGRGLRILTGKDCGQGDDWE